MSKFDPLQPVANDGIGEGKEGSCLEVDVALCAGVNYWFGAPLYCVTEAATRSRYDGGTTA